MSPESWWLVSHDDIREARSALGFAIEAAGSHGDHDLRALCERALYHLETGLHTTETVPKDYRNQLDALVAESVR